MMNKVGIIVLFVFLVGFVSAECNVGQIDINTAPAEKLDKIINVGAAIAVKIIANRTYSSVDDLLRVSGIGPITLEKIKRQGLACVDNESKEEVNETAEVNNEESNLNLEGLTNLKEETNLSQKNEAQSTSNNDTAELTPISLNSNAILEDSKDIKSEDNKEILRKNLPLYGIIAFCAVFVMAFLLKRRKKKHGFD
jgi:hypothetical protein